MQLEADTLASLGEFYFMPHTVQMEEFFLGKVYETAVREEADIWICDPMGNILASYGPSGKTEVRTVTSAQLRLKLLPYLQDSFSDMDQHGTTSFTNFLLYDSLTFAWPVQLQGVEGTAMGVVLLHTREPDMTEGKLTIAAFLFIAWALLMALMESSLYALDQRRRRLAELTRQVSGGQRLHAREEDFQEEPEAMADLQRIYLRMNRQESSEIAFVANASHELRSPITSIQGFAQGLLEGVVPQEDSAATLKIIVEESRRLGSLIRDLLDLSRIESQLTPKKREPFELHEVIRRVVIRFSEIMAAKNLQLMADFRAEASWVLGDADRIEQVLVNLVDNAVKYTAEGRIRIWTYPTLQGKVVVGVADTGPGIAEADLPYIFDRFYKVDTSHTGVRGTGLGLAIVKSILEQHGSAIRVHSVAGRGTTFWFLLEETPKPEAPDAS